MVDSKLKMNQQGILAAKAAQSIWGSNPHIYEEVIQKTKPGQLFTVVHGRRDNGQKWNRDILTGCNERFFTTRTVRQQKEFPRGVLQSPSLKSFKTRLAKALRNLV